VVAFAGAYRARRDDPRQIPAGVDRDYFGAVYVGVYLAVAVVCWAAALPDYAGAKDGFTANGARTGSLPFAVIMAVISVALTIGAYRGTTHHGVIVTEPVEGPTPAHN
jgi:hypothetical protein